MDEETETLSATDMGRRRHGYGDTTKESAGGYHRGKAVIGRGGLGRTPMKGGERVTVTAALRCEPRRVFPGELGHERKGLATDWGIGEINRP